MLIYADMISPEMRSNTENEEMREARFTNPYFKIVSPNVALERIRSWQKEDKRVVMVDAVLDLPHVAHAEYFLACANLGDKLTLRVNSDAFVAKRKDPRGPIVKWEERAKHAARYPYIDLITSKDEGGWDWLQEYNPDVIIKSITSGSAVLEEIDKVKPYLIGLRTTLIVMDEYGNIIPIEQAQQKGSEYEADKLTTQRISGSIIKDEIIKRSRDSGVIVDFTQDKNG